MCCLTGFYRPNRDDDDDDDDDGTIMMKNCFTKTSSKVGALNEAGQLQNSPKARSNLQGPWFC